MTTIEALQWAVQHPDIVGTVVVVGLAACGAVAAENRRRPATPTAPTAQETHR